jgi:hypothetical protein
LRKARVGPAEFGDVTRHLPGIHGHQLVAEPGKVTANRIFMRRHSQLPSIVNRVKFTQGDEFAGTTPANGFHPLKEFAPKSENWIVLTSQCNLLGPLMSK